MSRGELYGDFLKSLITKKYNRAIVDKFIPKFVGMGSLPEAILDVLS
jgi:hypothetical protein